MKVKTTNKQPGASASTNHTVVAPEKEIKNPNEERLFAVFDTISSLLQKHKNIENLPKAPLIAPRQTLVSNFKQRNPDWDLFNIPRTKLEDSFVP